LPDIVVARTANRSASRTGKGLNTLLMIVAIVAFGPMPTAMVRAAAAVHTGYWRN
jgi:hypothetical protein